ncbi:MAG TPA: TylF/MycF/NovP-related O-methyltransferase [Dongiaceae bacterium]
MPIPKILAGLLAVALFTRLRERGYTEEGPRPSLKKSVLGVMDRFGMGQPARRASRALRRSIKYGRTAVHAHTLWGWEPLVPEEQFSACCRHAIQLLRSKNPDHVFGDYLEFGVSRGSSLACMYRALQSEGLPHIRLLGFDSFQGLPPEAKAQGWSPGDFWSTRSTTERYLQRRGVDLRRVTLTEGWFKNTLTKATRQRLNIATSSLIMVDCDIYSAARETLWFCEPLIGDVAVVFFDDWASKSVQHNLGEREAFQEFLDEFPGFSAEPLPTYSPNARVFLLTRRKNAR